MSGEVIGGSAQLCEVPLQLQVNAAIEIQVLQVSSVSDNWRIEKVDPNQSTCKVE